MGNSAIRILSAGSLISTLFLGACTSTAEPTTMLRTGSTSDENACLAAVARETNATGVVLSSDFSQAATIVMVGVGPSRAPWKCLVSGGRVSEVSFDGDEGRL